MGMLLPLCRGDHVLDAAVGQGMDLGGQTLVDGAGRQPAFQDVRGHLLPVVALDHRHLTGAGLGQAQDLPLRIGEGGGDRVMAIQPVGSAGLLALPRAIDSRTIASHTIAGAASRALVRTLPGRLVAGAAAGCRGGPFRLSCLIVTMRPMLLILLEIAGPTRAPFATAGRRLALVHGGPYSPA